MTPDRVEQQRRVAACRWRTGRSGRATMRRRRARSATPRRRWASCRPRRRAPRVGGSSRRCRSRARAARTRPRPRPRSRPTSRRAPASRSCGLCVGPNAEFSVELPIANSSRFVLPTTTAPAPASRCTTVASYGGRQPSRMRDEHVVATPRVQRLSLSATGTPASGPGSSPCATAASTASAAARAESAITVLNAWMLGFARVDARQVLLEHVTGAAPPGPDVGRDVDGRVSHDASPRMRGTRKRSSADSGAAASTSARSRQGRGSSARSTLTSGSGCEVGGTSPVSSAAICAAWARMPASCGVSSSISSSLSASRARRADVHHVGAGQFGGPVRHVGRV